MNREDVIRWAREANIKQAIETPHLLMVHELERFAALVAAAENEKLAAEAERNGNTILAMQIRARRQTP